MKFLNLFINVFTCFANLGIGARPSNRKNKPTEPRRKRKPSYKKEPRPDLKAENNDQQELKKNGVNYRLKFLGSRDMGYKEDLEACEMVVREMTGPGKEDVKSCSPEIVMTMAPTRVLVAMEKPYTILHNHLMSSITNAFVSRDDYRFFMYSVKDPDTDAITCYCFRTQKKITGLRMIRTFRFAKYCWETIKQPEHPRVIALRRAYAARVSSEQQQECSVSSDGAENREEASAEKTTDHLTSPASDSNKQMQGNPISPDEADNTQASAEETADEACNCTKQVKEKSDVIEEASPVETDTSATMVTTETSFLILIFSRDDQDDDEQAAEPRCAASACDVDSDSESLHSVDLAEIGLNLPADYLSQKPHADLDDLSWSAV